MQTNSDGQVIAANTLFLDLVHAPSPAQVIGRSIDPGSANPLWTFTFSIRDWRKSRSCGASLRLSPTISPARERFRSPRDAMPKQARSN